VTHAYRKKLIEVALPLEAINRESAREKSIRQGHPSTLHLWWARRPLAACRAVLFASIVDDPSSRPDLFPSAEEQDVERQRLFRIIEELVKWENSSNEVVLEAARAEIRKATNGSPPAVLDPFCGGGSIPLEAQRLGLDAQASDLNPVAVLITKALIEIPPQFAGRSPVNPDSRARLAHDGSWIGAQGLADDVRYYGKWMRDEAFHRIGDLYPTVETSSGGQATVLAWLWARTVTCPNPACGAPLPLVRSFALSKKKGKEVFVEPRIADGRLSFKVSHGIGRTEGTVNRLGASCLVCGDAVPLDYVRSEGKAGRIGSKLMAIVAEGVRGRLYLSPDDRHEELANSAEPAEVPDTDLPAQALGFRVQGYGMTKHQHLFTKRQLVALTVLSDLVREVRGRVVADGGGAEYADAIALNLALAVDRLAMTGNTLVRWNPVGEKAQHAFGRQTLSMVWDYAEPNFFAGATGGMGPAVELVADPLERLGRGKAGSVRQLDATQVSVNEPVMIATDPPYYDNVPYADLSDVFYVWLRRSLRGAFDDILSTLLTPKAQELVADVYRFDGDKARAESFFETGLGAAFARMREAHDARYPLTVFYAFKQTETRDDAAVTSTGWETMLEGLVRAGFSIDGTWPMRTEMPSRMRNMASNALASSIVLVCRPRPEDAPVTDRRTFIAALRAELPVALTHLQRGNIAPVDLAQAAIGPGMAIFSRHARVMEATGDEMTVRTALGLINAALDEILAEQEGDFDADTRFAVAWFEQTGLSEADYGQADVLARAKNTSVRGLEEAGILASTRGKVRLLRREELSASWDPAADRRLTIWEVTQQLVRRLEVGGESDAAALLRRVGGLGETARELAYRLYTICERKGWSQEALGYNSLVVAWPEIARHADGTPEFVAQQALEI
jgi:putative DNA methylase